MPKITEVYAFIVEDTGPDDEGIAAFLNNGVWFPMVGADMERVNLLKLKAKMIAASTGRKIHLVKFTQRAEMEVIG